MEAISIHQLDLEHVVNQIEQTGISTICETIRRFNIIIDQDNLGAKNEDLENLIKKDLSLGREVLKVANSPVYRSVGRINIADIPTAITMIGWNEIYKIAMLSAVKGLIVDSEVNNFAHWLFNKGIAIAHISEELLNSLKTDNDELAHINTIYAYGLLHDIGALGMLQTIKDYQKDVMERKLLNGGNWCEAEIELYGFDHTLVGYEVLSLSRLPLGFSDTAKYHHKPDYNALTKTEGQRVALIRLALAAYGGSSIFADHESFEDYAGSEEVHKIRDYTCFPPKLKLEFEQILSLDADLYEKIKDERLTQTFIENIESNFL